MKIGTVPTSARFATSPIGCQCPDCRSNRHRRFGRGDIVSDVSDTLDLYPIEVVAEVYSAFDPNGDIRITTTFEATRNPCIVQALNLVFAMSRHVTTMNRLSSPGVSSLAHDYLYINRELDTPDRVRECAQKLDLLVEMWDGGLRLQLRELMQVYLERKAMSRSTREPVTRSLPPRPTMLYDISPPPVTITVKNGAATMMPVAKKRARELVRD